MSTERLVAACCGALMLASVLVAGRQEKPVRPTSSWQAWTIPQAGLYDEVRVDVVDTEGVCLYVARTYPGMKRKAPALAAVPKTQLPRGTGCQ